MGPFYIDQQTKAQGGNVVREDKRGHGAEGLVSCDAPSTSQQLCGRCCGQGRLGSRAAASGGRYGPAQPTAALRGKCLPLAVRNRGVLR